MPSARRGSRIRRAKQAGRRSRTSSRARQRRSRFSAASKDRRVAVRSPKRRFRARQSPFRQRFRSGEDLEDILPSSEELETQDLGDLVNRLSDDEVLSFETEIGTTNNDMEKLNLEDIFDLYTNDEKPLSDEFVEEFASIVMETMNMRMKIASPVGKKIRVYYSVTIPSKKEGDEHDTKETKASLYVDDEQEYKFWKSFGLVIGKNRDKFTVKLKIIMYRNLIQLHQNTKLNKDELKNKDLFLQTVRNIVKPEFNVREFVEDEGKEFYRLAPKRKRE